MTIGTHSVVVAGVDISCLVDSVSIQHGRSDTDSQPEANACTVDISLDRDTADLPAALDVGATLTVTTRLAGVDYTRFSGTVTDLNQGWEDQGPETPDAVQAQVVATGPTATLGRRIVGDTPWPQQIDGDRIHAILDASGVPWDPLLDDPGTVQILARDVDSQPALDLAQAVAQDAGGILWSTVAGTIHYADANHRRGITPSLQLDACDILVTPTWRRTTEGLINHVSIGYGPTPEGGEQPRYVADRTDSQTRFGVFGLEATTQLAALADASAMGQLLLTRNREPVWILAALPVDIETLSDADTAILLGLEMHSLIEVTGMPAAGSVPTSAALWVEGWTETLAWAQHDMQLQVSGYCRTVPPPHWDDVDPAWTWDGIGGRLLATNMSNRPVPSAAFPWATTGTPVPTIAYANDPTMGNYATVTWAAITAIGTVFTTATLPLAIMAGKVYTASVYLRNRGAVPLNVYPGSPANGTLIPAMSTGAPATVPADGQWHRYNYTATAIGTGSMQARVLELRATGAASTTGQLDITRHMFTEGAPIDYFDGDTPDTDAYRFDWTGAAGVSASTQSTAAANPTWDEMTCIGPLPNRGRWDDVPASQRWDQLPPSQIWNNWPTPA